MEGNHFTEGQVKELKQNKYVRNVTLKSISFTKEFKEHFLNESETGKGPTRIFIESGFNPYILGSERIKGFSKRIKKKRQKNGSLEDTRGKKSTGRPKKSIERILTPDEEIEKLKHENVMLKAENDLLKKMKFLVEQQESKKFQHNKDIK